MPAWLYAIVFLVGSFFAIKMQNDNVGHDAHLGGAMVGMLTTVALHPGIVRESPKMFITISLVSLVLFIYLAMNPMLLPLSAVLPGWLLKKNSPSPPPHQRDALAVTRS